VEDAVMDLDPSPPSGRSTFLTVLMLTLVAGAGLVFCIGLMGAFVIEALTLMTLIGGVGLCHYLLWGRSLSQEVEAEREEADTTEDEEDRWPLDGPRQPRRF
jgi:hypothetical protein